MEKRPKKFKGDKQILYDIVDLRFNASWDKSKVTTVS